MGYSDVAACLLNFKPSLKLVLATNNQHKISEIRAILKKKKVLISILTLNDFPARPQVIENKKTIEGNAIKKAEEIARYTNCLALADDTGLFIHALKGKPGVYSARFAGPRCNYLDNCKKVLNLMNRTPTLKRTSVFKTVAALATPNGHLYLAKGEVKGRIATELRGKNGFGYDPIFYPAKSKKTYAEMSTATKNKVSHRAKAFSKVPHLLKKILKKYN